MPRPSTPLKRALCVLASLCTAATSFAAVAATECHAAASGIPATAPGAVSGREFAARVAGLEGAARDEEVRTELLAGDLPQHLRHFAAVHMHGRTTAGEAVEITLCVMPDYLAVGSDEDALLMPMGLPTALLVAGRYGFVLPTPRMVDAIYDAASIKLAPEPLPAGDQMRSTEYYVAPQRMIAAQRAALGGTARCADAPATRRIWSIDRAAVERAGPGGDLRLAPGDDAPIQPLSTVHGWRYADYSHGVRLIEPDACRRRRPRGRSSRCWRIRSSGGRSARGCHRGPGRPGRSPQRRARPPPSVVQQRNPRW